MSTSGASYGRWAVATAETPFGHKTGVAERAERGNARSPFRRFLGLLDDARERDDRAALGLDGDAQDLMRMDSDKG